MRHAVVEADVAGIAEIVVHGEEHDRLFRAGAQLAGVIALEGYNVAVAPAWTRATAGELMMQPREVRHLVVVELAEEWRIGVAREGMITRSFVVGIAVNERNAFAQEIVGVLEFTPCREIVVMTLRVHDAHPRAETAPVTLLVAGEARAGIAENVVQVIAQRIVEEPHPGIRILAEARRLTEMLAEDQRVIAGKFGIEIGVALIRVRVAVSQVELKLRLPHVARGILILVRAALQPEEIARHMLHGVEAQTIAFRLVDQVADSTKDGGVDVLAKSIGVCVQVRLRDVAEAHAHTGGIEVVKLRVIRMPHVERLRRRAAFRRTEISVGAFVRHIHQAKQRPVLHLPDIVVVRDVVPVPVEASGDGLQMKIPRHGSRKQIRGHAGIVARHVSGAVVHHVVEIDAQPEAMRQCDHALQFILGSVTRGRGAALVLVAEIERIEEIVADGEAAIALGRRRQPQAGVTRLGDLRQLLADLVPRKVEELEHRVGPRGQCEREEQHNG